MISVPNCETGSSKRKRLQMYAKRITIRVLLNGAQDEICAIHQGS
nr:MAG TPA: hypothetical protein [Caudoviricetes sp.]